MTQNVHRILLPKTARDKTNLDRSKNDDTIKQKQKISQQLKQKYIQDLKDRNKKIKNQIQAITLILDQQEQKQKQKYTKKQKVTIKSKIGITGQQNNTQLLKKELQNIYKQIKNYQREIQKSESSGTGVKVSSFQLSKLQQTKLQKLQHLQKLRSQLSELQANQVVNSKKLKNNLGRQYYQNLAHKIGDQLKVLREKLRNVQDRQKQKVANAKKQLEYIKKLQAELVESGMPLDQIQQMKQKNVYTQVKNIMSGLKDVEKAPSTPINHQYDDDIDHITYAKLQQYKNEIKLYKKLHLDYEKRVNSIIRQKQSASSQIIDKRKIIQQKNIQIQKLTQQINQVKQLVRKNTNNLTNSIGDSLSKSNKKKTIQVSKKNGQQDKKNIINLINSTLADRN